MKNYSLTGCNLDEVFGGGTQIRTGDKGFADLCLTTWPCRRLEAINNNNRFNKMLIVINF